MQVTVKVLKFTGETGLRKPGSLYSLDHITAAFLAGKGLVQIEQKELKTVIETKELKTRPAIKAKAKRKRKG